MLWDFVYPHLTPSATCVLGGREEPQALGLNVIILHIYDWDGFVQKEAVVSVVEHTVCIVSEDWLCLDMEVTHHVVAIPPNHHPYVAEVHLAMDEGHGSTSS
jgi:hypothetical protein